MTLVPRIEICGNIASGKTTLSKGITACGLKSGKESFSNNPFIKDFYKNSRMFSFETEITFLLQHYHSIKTTEAINSIVCDYSLTLDKAYSDVTLPPGRRYIFMQIAEELEYEIGLPEKIIHLQCPEEVLLSRIKKRRRYFESSITIDYLRSLTLAIENRVREIPSHVEVVTINSHKINFTEGIADSPELASICQF